MRHFVVVVVAIVVAGVAVGCAASRELGARAFQAMTNMSPAPPVVTGVLPGGIEAVCSRGSLSWIVPVDDGGVVLVDTGFDDEARAIKHALRGRPLHAILLTHGHVDHAAGTASLDAPVYIGRADAPALRGEHTFEAPYPLLGEIFGGIPVAKGAIHDVDDGEVHVFGNRRFTAIAMPGHTHGSTAWLVDDVLFSGDALLAPLGDDVYPAAPGFSVDIDAAYDSIRRLRDVDIHWLADAHYGVVREPRQALRRALEKSHGDIDVRREFPVIHPVGCGGTDPVEAIR